MELKVLETQTKETKLAKWTRYRIEPPEVITTFNQCYGIDPGTTHTGVAVIPYIDNRAYIDLYQIVMPRWADAVDRILHWQDVLGTLPLIIQLHSRMVIEGAAYGRTFRQVELAEIRASTVMWAHRLGVDIRLIQPNSVRKAVLGNGKLKAEDVWYLKDAPDAVAALACAYYASNHWEKTNEIKQSN